MSARRRQHGLSLMEVLVAVTITVMMATAIWSAFDQTAKMRDKLSSRQEHDHLARMALERIGRDLRAAYLSLHVNQNQMLATVLTQFVGVTANGNAKVDFTTFTHRRLRRSAHEGDACEVGYRVEEHRADDGLEGWDLLRREAPRVDADPVHGGTVDVLVPGIRRFDLRYWDDSASRWIDTWDTTQATGQAGRLPQRVRITLTLEEGRPPVERVYSTETTLMLTRPLTFGLPIY